MFKRASLLSSLALAALLSAPAASAQTFAGPYLAATQADMRNDYVEASRRYALALVEASRNPELLQQAMVAQLGAGDYDTALVLARQLETVSAGNSLTALLRFGDHVARGKYEEAQALISSDEMDINVLLKGLLQGWSAVGLGDYAQAEAAFDSLQANEPLLIYGQYHKALALALAGDMNRAEALLAGDEDGPRYINAAAVIAHAQILAELDRREDALAALDQALGMGFGGEAIPQLAAKLQTDEEISFDVIRDPAEGASEAVLLLAGALTREQADRRALVYTRVSQHMSPVVEEAALLAADILQQQGQYDLATKEYAKIPPESVLFDNAEIGRSDALYAAERTDEAVEVLSALVRKSPDNADVRVALGDLYRRTEAFDEASVAYSDALELLGDRAGWFLYYSRGITYERTDRWDQAEADFRKALEIEPDQPLVLNYLGYSLVELRRNYDEALEMIQTAVEQRPEDGYITDSLGWVFYRIGRFEEAVAPMERAVELAPIDPIINDHLGDVYWKVGRTLEAEFQWRRALSFEPEPEDAERIRRKLEVGLDEVLAEEEAATPTQDIANDG